MHRSMSLHHDVVDVVAQCCTVLAALPVLSTDLCEIVLPDVITAVELQHEYIQADGFEFLYKQHSNPGTQAVLAGMEGGSQLLQAIVSEWSSVFSLCAWCGTV